MSKSDKNSKQNESKISWQDVKPKKSDVMAGLIIGVICVALIMSIAIANKIFGV